MPQFEPKKVLIVDDSIDMRELLTQLLESQGYSVSTRNNGEEALEFLNSDDSLPSVILLDLRMPVMDGLDFLKFQKSSTRLKDIRIVMMTAENDLKDVEQSFNVEYLPKPLSMKAVLNAVSKRPFQPLVQRASHSQKPLN